MLVYPFAEDARWGNRNRSSLRGRRSRIARFVDGDPHLLVAVASSRSKGKDQTIARMLASKPCVPEEITPAEREMPPRKKLRRFPYFTV